MSIIYPKTVVFDFDGVIHSYMTPWKSNDVIPDLPVPGIKESIDSIRAAGYHVIIVSARFNTYEGMQAVKQWLNKYHIKVDGMMREKPPAIVYIDDRAICFDGNPEKLLSQIEKFKPWNR